MNNAFVMGITQGVADLGDNLQSQRRRQFLGLHELTDIFPVHKLHAEVKEAVTLAEIKNRNDVRMIEPSQRASLASETLGKGRIPSHFGRQNLESQESIQLGL